MVRSPKSLAGILGVAATCLAPTVAAQTTVAVLAVDHPGVDAASAAEIDRGLVEGVRRSRDFEVDDQTRSPLVETMLLLGCSGVQPSCVAELASTLGVDVVMVAAIDGRVPEKLQIGLHDGFSGRPFFERVVTLDRSPAGDVNSAALARVVDALLNGRLVVRIETSAPGEVTVNGQAFGRTPALVTTLEPGDVRVVVAFDDGRTATVQRRFETSDEVVLSVSPSGRRHASQATARGGARAGDTHRDVDANSGDPRPLRAAGWTAAVVGAGTLGAAAYFGSALQSSRRDFDATPFQRQAAQAAADGERAARNANICIAAGATGIAAGVSLLIADARRGTRHGTGSADRGMSVALAPTPGGANVTFGWSR